MKSYEWLRHVTKKWHSQTPPSFRFSISIPNDFLFSLPCSINDTTTISADPEFGNFLEYLAPVEEKVLSVIIRVPASISLNQGRSWLEGVLATCTYHGYTAAVQFSHQSWYQDLTYNILKKNGAVLIWTDTYPCTVTTSDFLYLRLVSNNYDRNTNNESIWIKRIQKTIVEERQIDSVAMVLPTPARANLFLTSLGLPERKPPRRDGTQSPIPLFSSSSFSSSASSSEEEGQGKHNNWKGKIIFCVDLNAFYPSCEELRNPVLRGKAHAVIMTDEDEGKITKGVVSSCSYEARKYGIRSAMSLSKALTLCPALILTPVDIPYYSEISKKVMAILESYADIVEQASIDEAFLDCSSKISLDVTPGKYAITIKQAIKAKLELQCSVGVAHTRSAAKIASDYRKPDGLTVIYPDDLKNFLAPLEVNSVAGIGPKTQQALKEMGILTLGQLAKADVHKLKERFGKNGQWMWKVANGTDDDPVTPRGDHVSLSTENTLDKFTKDKEEIISLLQELVPELYERAQKRGYMFRTVGVKLVKTDFSVETREISFDEFQSSPESISSQIEYLVAKFSMLDTNVDANNEHAVIRKVGLKISNLARIVVDHGTVAAQTRKLVQKTLLDYY